MKFVANANDGRYYHLPGYVGREAGVESREGKCINVFVKNINYAGGSVVYIAAEILYYLYTMILHKN